MQANSVAGFVTPMLASPLPTDLRIVPGKYVAEEKWDGHRLIVRIGGAAQHDLFAEGNSVQAWSRDGLPRALPRHISDALSRFPVCLLDGELLVPGKRSYGVTELKNSNELVYVAFDILEVCGESACDLEYKHRRSLLTEIFNKLSFESVRLAWSKPVNTVEEVKQVCHEVWARDGEGLILKDVESLYLPGKRPKLSWIKIKQLHSAVLTITGYEYGLSGPYSKVTLVDDEGIKVTVKVRNTELRNRCAANPSWFIGKPLRIEYQERTLPDRSYRHPRWDRLESE